MPTCHKRAIACRLVVLLGVLGFAACPAWSAGPAAATSNPPTSKPAGQWKTVFASRLIYAAARIDYVSGRGGTLRMAIPMPFAGTKVRVHVTGVGRVPIKLKKMALVKGADDKGRIVGPLYPVLFGGKASVALGAGPGKASVSDAADAAITKGLWYLQDSYTSEAVPVTISNYWGFHAPGDQFKKAILKKRIQFRLGATNRIDVYTTDTRPLIACYGDSITRGMESATGSGDQYPLLLSKLIGRPVLNLGIDGDQISTNIEHCPRYIKGLAGVKEVVFLMGINDLLKGAVTKKKDYVAGATRIIAKLREQKLKVYVGTLAPAGGPPPYIVRPATDKLRMAINDWIRTRSGADGVIDFDAAIRDPKNPSRMLTKYQSGDWLHPSAAGYRKMAEAAAATLRKTTRRATAR